MTKTIDAQTAVFKGGSTTYFSSSIFFPPEVRRDVTVLYAFVRVADDFVDAVPQKAVELARFRERYRSAQSGLASGDRIIDDFVQLACRKGFDAHWTEAFLHSMELDLHRSHYDTIAETLDYIYGSAEVVGFFMERILDLPPAAHEHARMLGRAMQYINFIRDLDEDAGLGRRYLPLDGTSLRALDREEAAAKPAEFAAFIRRELDRFALWQAEAERGFRYIPRRYLIAIKTASDMYTWTAEQIRRDPFVVFGRKVKPHRPRIVLRALGNAIRPYGGGRT